MIAVRIFASILDVMFFILLLCYIKDLTYKKYKAYFVVNGALALCFLLNLVCIWWR